MLLKTIFNLIYLLFITIIYIPILFANEECVWDNKNQISCLEVKNHISNTSRFSKTGINKIIINRKQIEESGATDLIDILKSFPDINITQSGPKGQQASIFMRGTGSNHTLVMINGIPINDQSTTQGLHDFGVDFIQTVQQIEVYPGSSATHFGTNSIGGAINIILTGDYENKVNVTSDYNGNYELFANKTKVYENSSINIKLGNVKNKSISARGNIDDEKDGVVNYSSNINYENYLNNNLRFFNNIYIRQTIAEYDSSDTKQTDYESDNRMGAVQFGFENLSEFTENNYIFYYNIYDREYDERGTIDTYKSEVAGVKYDFSKTLNDLISFGLGSEYKYNWGYFNNNGSSYEASTKGNSDNFSLYGNLGWNISKNLNSSFFVRNDNHKYTGNSKTYKINFEKIIGNSTLGTSYMKSLRNPTLYELFGTDNFGYSGNRELLPEKSNTFEVYSNLNFQNNISLSLRGFKSNIKNNIEYINNKYQNDDDNIDLNQSGLNSTLSINKNNFNAKFYNSILSSKKENGSGQLRRPRKNYGLEFSKIIKNEFIEKLKFNVIYNHYGKHIDTGSTQMDSTDIVDLIINKTHKDSTYFIKISNLLAENYQRPKGYNQEQRTIKFGIKY